MSTVDSRRLWIAMALMALLIWLPRGLALDRFVTADEHAWLARSGNFYRALSRGDLAATFQRHHPGVTTTWAGMAGYLTTYPAYAKEAPAYYGYLTEEVEAFLRSQGHDPLQVLAAGRAFVALAVTLSLLVAYWLAIGLLGFWPATLGFALIATAPFHIAHSRLLHLDGLVSSFMFLAIVAFVAYAQKPRWSVLMISGIAAGLAWLTRSPSLFLLPYSAVIGLMAIAWREPGAEARRTLWRMLKAGIIWAVVGVLCYVLLWPSMWINPVGSIQDVLSAATEYATEGHLKPIFFNGNVIAGDPGLSFYPITWLWRTTPLVLLGLAAAIAVAVARAAPLDKYTTRFTVASLVLYAVGFTLFMSLGAKKFDRYLLPVYPALALVAGMGITGLGEWLLRLVSDAVARCIMPALLAIVLVVQVILILPTFPYYLSYYNPLLGGGRRAPSVMMIGWGEGGDQAAAFLDEQPDAAQSVVASGYTNGPFSYFYDGETAPLYFRAMADYAVVFVQDWQRQLPSRRAAAYYAEHEPMHTVRINGIDYAHIYDLNAMPQPDYVTDWLDADGEAVIRLQSYQLPAAAIKAGETVSTILYLENRAPIDSNLNVLVRLIGADGQEIAREEGWPWGSATSNWAVGDVWPDGHDLVIPEDAQPGWYRLDVAFYDPQGQETLHAVQVDSGEQMGEALPLDYIWIGEVLPSAEQPLRDAVQFGETIQLQGVDWTNAAGRNIHIERTGLHAGDSVTANLLWESNAPTEIDYTAFVHVVNADGAAVLQLDRQPLNGFMPTSTWLHGQTVADPFELALPNDLPPGAYTVYTGFYDLTTMERLPVTIEGQPAGDTVEIATLTIN